MRAASIWIALFVLFQTASHAADLELDCKGDRSLPTTSPVDLSVSISFSDRMVTILGPPDVDFGSPAMLDGQPLKNVTMLPIELMDNTTIRFGTAERAQGYPNIPKVGGSISRTSGFMHIYVSTTGAIISSTCSAKRPRF